MILLSEKFPVAFKMSE
uniref:Uncharacterized protein n=1 Tax=Rhizophora mucronata TaxID=61149 RepID=A0A2P2MYD1_RHIMU